MAQPIRTNRIPQTIPRKAVSRRLFRCGRWSRKLIVTVTFEKAHGAGVTPDASARALKALSLSVGKDAVEHGHHYAWLRDYRARPLSFQAGLFLWHLAPRPSRMARLRPRGLGFAVALYTWASRGETLASTLAAQTVLRVREGRPLTRPMYLFGLRPLHLCGTRLEGGHQGLSRRYGSVEGEPLGWCRRRRRPLPEHQGDAEAVAGSRLPSTFLASAPAPACMRACVHACMPTMLPRALARPTRTSGFGRVFGAHPRGEFRTSGAAVGQIRTRAAQRPFRYETRRTV